MDLSRIPAVISWDGFLYSEEEKLEFVDLVSCKRHNVAVSEPIICCCCLGAKVYFVAGNKLYRWNIDAREVHELKLGIPFAQWKTCDNMQISETDLDHKNQFGHFGLHHVSSTSQIPTQNDSFLLAATDSSVYLVENGSDSTRLLLVDQNLETEFHPKLIQLGLSENVKVDQIDAGKSHVLLLDSNGAVYSFGTGSRGELGHGSLESESLPKLIEAMEGIKVVNISTGGWHSAAVTADGDVYFWGWNESGQLGFPQEQTPSCSLPQPLELSDDVCILSASCGSRHSVLLSSLGHMFGCGSNEYRQLGSEAPSVLAPLVGRARAAVAGSWTTLVICPE